MQEMNARMNARIAKEKAHISQMTATSRTKGRKVKEIDLRVETDRTGEQGKETILRRTE